MRADADYVPHPVSLKTIVPRGLVENGYFKYYFGLYRMSHGFFLRLISVPRFFSPQNIPPTPQVNCFEPDTKISRKKEE